jgi:hypothetical protein
MRTAIIAAAVGAAVAVFFTEASADRLERGYRAIAELAFAMPPTDADLEPRPRLVLVPAH